MIRRDLVRLALTAPCLGAASSLDTILREGINRRGIPAVAAAVATPDRTTYSAGFGLRDSASKIRVAPDSIFSVASMTKAITTVAALQLVEKGKLALDEPVGKHLSALARLEVLEGFNASGQPVLRPAGKAVTPRHLLTHTSGFAYETWNENLLRFSKISTGPKPILMTDPGTRWEYGTSTDWLGRLVEAVSGQSLEAYFQANILQPLGMGDTSFILPPTKFARKVSTHQRQLDGRLEEFPRKPPTPPSSYSGGGGLVSTTVDYVRFMQMILRRGAGPSGERILGERWIAMMLGNQIGDLSAGKMKSYRTERSSDVDFHPGFADKFTFGFLLNTSAHEGGRSAGSVAWAGMSNTFFWIDPTRELCAVIAMQYLPFCDDEAVWLLRDFERAVYAQPR